MVATNKATKKRTSSTGMTTQSLLDLDLEESSSDSDFRIEDHDNGSDDFSDNSIYDDDEDGEDDRSDEDNENDDSDDEESDEFSTFKNSLKPSSSGTTKQSSEEPVSLKKTQQQAKAKEALDKATAKLLATPICCACLGDRSDDTNEIVECDNCGISVHEACYGISDSNSVSSTVSSCSTEPWFCEACKANAVDPICELCPNKGGIFKETDVGKWVHLICALYVPGVAFGEVDQLSSVTLFEMPYSKWGAKSCSLCEDVRFSRTGVCIGCDAGMCKTYFHVTCAQAAGLLSEAHSEEADHADPFYAHCKIHSDKALIKHRKRNYNGLKLKMEHRKMEREQKKTEEPTEGQKRIERKLKKHRNKYVSSRSIKSEPWVPTQKMPRLLTTSASACRKLILKAELMGINAAASEFQEAQMAALADVRKKWHIPPAFSVEFIGYYLDRISRVKEITSSLQEQLESNKTLVDEQQKLRDQYDQAIKTHHEQTEKNNALKESIKKLHQTIQVLCPNKNLPSIENIGRPPVAAPTVFVAAPPTRPMVPTAAALKMGVGFPLTNLPGINDDTNRILSTQCQNNSKLMHECGICKRCNDQHLLAKCDTCHLHYHLGCLNPPLTRHPKKSKLYGWQCSECVKSDDSDAAITLPAGPRKSRTKYSKDGTIVPVDPQLFEATIDDRRSSVRSPDSYAKTTVKSPAPVAVAAAITTAKKPEKRATNVVEKMEEVLMPSVIDINKAPQPQQLKSKKTKATNAKPKSNETIVNNTEVIADLSAPDPLDISSAEQIIIPLTDDSKRVLSDSDAEKCKSNQKFKKDKLTMSPLSNARKTSTDTNSIPEIESISKSALGHFTSELIGADQNSETATTTQSSFIDMDTLHKQNRKRRKEKHRNKYGPDGERSQSKEHKKKRKKERHDLESVPLSTATSSDGIPKIKIKFKALPLPGETAAEPQFFYVSADMVRPAEISRSPIVVSEAKSSMINASVSNRSNATSSPGHNSKISLPSRSSFPPPPPAKSTSPTKIVPQFSYTPIRTRRLSVLVSPQRFLKESRKPAPTAPSTSAGSQQNTNSSTSSKCDVCREPGTLQDIVKCDECKKSYHFQCLDPPLKKSPKRRGYSWHCADCDPTDNDSN